MKKSKFNEEKIVAILKGAQSGQTNVQEVCRSTASAEILFISGRKNIMALKPLN